MDILGILYWRLRHMQLSQTVISPQPVSQHAVECATGEYGCIRIALPAETGVPEYARSGSKQTRMRSVDILDPRMETCTLVAVLSMTV